MPVTLSRIEDRRYIQLATLEGVVTVAELDTWMNENLQIMDEHSLTLNGIVDMRKLTRLQTSPFQIPSVLRSVRHPFAGWGVIVGATPLIGSWVERFERFFGVHIQAMDSVEQGIRFIREETWEPYMAGSSQIVLYPAPRWLTKSVHFSALTSNACMIRIVGVAKAHDMDIINCLLLEVLAHRETPLYVVFDVSQCQKIIALPDLMPRSAQLLLDPLIREYLLVGANNEVHEFGVALGALTPHPVVREFRTMTEAEFFLNHTRLTYSG